jgi:hypothetical protein
MSLTNLNLVKVNGMLIKTVIFIYIPLLFAMLQSLMAQSSLDTLSFQDGVNGYFGTRDTKIIADRPNKNYGTDSTLEVDGGDVLSSESTLISWDLTDIPPASTIISVEITFNVANTSSDSYELYEMKRSWIETEATWDEYASVLSWEIPGADGSADRGSTVLGTMTGPALEITTNSLNSDGVAVVQSWVDNPSSNHGFICLDYINADNGMDFSSREAEIVSNRPKLTVTYVGSGTPLVSIDDVVVAEGSEGTVDAVFTVNLSASSDQTVTVDYGTADSTAITPDDYTAVSGQVSFAPGETSKPVTVVVKGDVLDEFDETFVVNLSNAVNAIIIDNQGIGTISDPSGIDYLEVRVAARSDDAEERSSGIVKFTSKDCELVEDPTQSGAYQTVGIRFNGLTIPQSSLITTAYVQFEAAGADNEVTLLNFHGEASDNAVTFDSVDFNITSRPLTNATASWAPPEWTTPGEAGINQRTPNIASVIQEIVNRAGWVEGNSIALIVTGIGERKVVSYDGDVVNGTSGAPLLHVEYMPAPVLVEVKLFLEGPYDVTGDTMKTALRDNDFIPFTSPYSEDPRLVSSIPLDITDWVLVQLRETDTGTAVASKSAFLRNDGRVVDDDGTSEQITMDVAPGNYYIVIEHRNHLAVMSANFVALSSGSSTLYDFSTGSGQYYGSAAKELEIGVLGMYTGAANGNNQVQNDDKNVDWATQVGAAGYRGADFNLNGQVQNDDKNLLWNANVGAGSQVP